MRWPASSAACFTQFRIAWAEGSNCRPSSSGVRPFRTNSTSRARNFGGYGRWLFGIVDAPFRPNSGVSTKPGQLHPWLLRCAKVRLAYWRRIRLTVGVLAVIGATSTAAEVCGPTGPCWSGKFTPSSESWSQSVRGGGGSGASGSSIGDALSEAAKGLSESITNKQQELLSEKDRRWCKYDAPRMVARDKANPKKLHELLKTAGKRHCPWVSEIEQTINKHWCNSFSPQVVKTFQPSRRRQVLKEAGYRGCGWVKEAQAADDLRWCKLHPLLRNEQNQIVSSEAHQNEGLERACDWAKDLW